MSERRYPITYEVTFQDPPLDRLAIPKGHGACDAVVILSLLYPEDGSFSMLPMSRDGRTGEELSDAELFKCWTLLAAHLAESKTLSPEKRQLAAQLFDVVRQAVATARGAR
jgi:hypothetical protein